MKPAGFFVICCEKRKEQMKKYLGPAYLTLAASLWGGVYVVSKVVLDVLPALELIWLRYLLALVALAIFGLLTGES